MASRHLRQRIKTLVHTLFDRKQSGDGRRTPAKAASRRQSTRKAMSIQPPQQLEPRLALTVGFLEQSPLTPEKVASVLVSAGDNLYMTKVADASVLGSSAGALRYDMWIDNSSTFLNKQVIKDIDAFDMIAVTSGTRRSEEGVRADSYPLHSRIWDNTTRFVLSRPRLMDYEDRFFPWGISGPNSSAGELRGTISLTQPDGSESTWSFSNWDQSRSDRTTDPRFLLADGKIRFTKGPGWGENNTYESYFDYVARSSSPSGPQTLPNGFYKPISILLKDNSRTSGDLYEQAASLEIQWNQPLTGGSVPSLSVTYSAAKYLNGNRSDTPQEFTDEALLPSVPATAAFQLPAALDQSSRGVIPGTLSGTIRFANGTVTEAALPFFTRRTTSAGVPDLTLYFDVPTTTAQGTTSVQQGTESFVQSKDGSRIFVRGTYATNGSVALSFFSRETNNTRPLLGDLLGPQAPGNVTIDATYAVIEPGAKGSSATLFAGHTLLNNLDVDLLTPGSSVNINSPLRSPSIVSLNATNISFNSDTTAGKVLSVGEANGSAAKLKTVQQAQAIAEISTDGKVERLIPVVGSEGAGYDPFNLPPVTLAMPVLQAAFTTTSDALVITTTDVSFSTACVGMTVSGPGIQADTKVASVSRIVTGTNVTGTKVTLTKPLSPLPTQPTLRVLTFTGSQATFQAVVDSLTGRITGYKPTNEGGGYTMPPMVTIGGPAAAIDATAEVTNGSVTSIKANGSVFVEPISLAKGGSGYANEPTVEFSAPSSSNGRRAQGTATIKGGRVVAITITDPGTGYLVGENVAVTIGDPEAGGTRATATAYVATGYGYLIAPQVTIDAPTVVSGTQARASTKIDDKGRITAFTILESGSGYFPVTPKVTIQDSLGVTETVRFNTTVAAPTYRLDVGDDPFTKDIPRGELFVSQTSSLSGLAFAPAGLFHVQADQSNIRVEGRVRATVQTWYLSSAIDASDLSPFQFTTRATSGQQTGQIIGDQVQMVLANDAPTFGDDNAVIFNDIDIATDIASLRVSAATREAEPRRDPFPYELTIEEVNDLAIDAVAASSFPITISVGGKLNFNAAIATAGALVVNAAGDFALGAPVSSTRGPIAITGTNVLINNSLKVTDVRRDDTKDDIILTATGGDIQLDDNVTAVNRVRLVQRNRSTPQQVVRRYTGLPVAINDYLTSSVLLTLDDTVDDFTFTKLQVEVGITHTYDGDLSGTLIAPDGARIRLFQNVGGSGDNFTNTVFDSAAAQSIYSGSAPFTGTFRPIDSLTPLAGRRAIGTWKLEVRDSGGGDIGQITAFNLVFTTDARQDGMIAGEGRITSDSINILAEGSVGSPNVTPSQGIFHLHTDTNSLEARAGRSAAIEDLDQVTVPFLTAGGIVTLKALGYDDTVVVSADTFKDQRVVTVASTAGLWVGMAVTGDGIPNGARIQSIDEPVLGGRPTITLTDNATKKNPGVPLRFAVPALVAKLFDLTAIDASTPNGSVKVDVFTPYDVVFGNSTAIAAGKGVSMATAGDVQIRVSGGSNSTKVDVLDAPLAGSAARLVRAVNRESLAGVYDKKNPGFFASTITSDTRAGDPGYKSLEEAFGMPANSLRIGDRLLVMGGVTLDSTAGPSKANGIYTITALGKESGERWLLTRSPDSDTRDEFKNNTFVRRIDATTGAQTIYQITYADDLPSLFGDTPIAVAERAVVADIGSYDPLSELRFVVSTNDGTNLGVGSLGKMLQLHHANLQNSSVNFADSVSTISLVEELPRIRRLIDIDGADTKRFDTGLNKNEVKPILVDGSRISRSFYGTVILPGEAFDGFRFSTGADESRLANVHVGGFLYGAAVSVEDADRVRIDGVTLGKTSQEAKLLNRYGVQVKRLAEATTVSGSTIVSSREAGVKIDANASGVVLVGNTIGELNFDNYAGVVVENGTHRIGARSVPTVQAKITRAAPRVLTLQDVSFPFEALYAGQGVTGIGLAPGSEIVSVNASLAQITISTDANLDASVRDEAFSLLATFETPDANKIQKNLYGIRLLDGSSTVTNTTVQNNAFAGIRIEGGRHTIGVSTARSDDASNQIHTSPAWGILVKAATNDTAKALADYQIIQGNYFVPSKAKVGDTAVQNKLGAIGIEWTDAQTTKQAAYFGASPNEIWRPFAPPADDAGTDARGNLHFAVVDTIKPVATIQAPLDADGKPLNDSDSGANAVEVRGSTARTATTFVIRLNDDGSGVDKDTIVKEAFSLSRDGTVLVEGRDYIFSKADESARFVSPTGAFPLGIYTLTVTSRAAQGTTPAWLTDLNKNTLVDAYPFDTWNQRFTVELVDVPDKLRNVQALSGDTLINLSWDAAVSPVEIEYYVYQYATSNSSNADWLPKPPRSAAALAATIMGLDNGQQYWLRVAAVNKAGTGDWAVVGPIMPLPAPKVSLYDDNGVSMTDGVTNNGRVDVALLGGTAWQYRVKGGAWTSPSRLSDRSFTLAPGKYEVGDVRVRQGVVGSTSPEGFNPIVFDIDTVAPTVVRFTSSTVDGTYGLGKEIQLSAALSESVRKGDTLEVTLDTGAKVTLRAADQGLLLDGIYTVRAGENSNDLTVFGYSATSVFDLAGNLMRSTSLPQGVDNLGGSKAIVVDTLPPPRPVISGVADDVAPVFGNVPDGGFTNDTVLVFTGTTQLGSKVRVYDGATLLGPATVTNNQWTFTTSQLANKTYAFKAQASDGSDNVSEDSFVYTVTVDTSAPSRPTITGVTDDVVPIVGVVPDGGVTNDTVLVISGTTEDGSTVQIFNGASLLGAATVSGTGWTFTAGALADGSTYTFKARATDRAGNVGVDSAAYTVTIDTTGAATLVTGVTDDFGSVQGNIPNGGSTDDTTLVVSGSTEEGSTVQVFNGTTLLGSALVQGRGWTFTTGTLVNRTTYSFKSQATDRAGNVGPQSTAYVVTIDTDAPDAPVITGLTGGVLSGTVEAGCTVQVFTGATLLGPATMDGTKWSIPLTTLIDGSTYTFTAKATDTAGNVGPESVGYTVTIDLTPPKPIIAAVIDDVFPVIGVVPNAGSTNDTILELTGTTESGSTVQVFNGTTLLGSANVDGETWSFVTPALIDGATYEFIARATDASNNQGGSPAHRVTIDTAPPMVRRFSSTTADGFYASGRQANVTATLSEAVHPGSSIVVTLDTKAKLTLTAPTAGTTLTGTYTVQPGDNSADLTVESFTVNSVTDFAGNVLNSLSVPTGTDNLGGAKNIAIDTTSPSILSFTTSTAGGAYGAGTAIPLTAVASETLQAGSRIAATLNTGAVVTLTAVSEGTSLIGTYTVPAGHNASNLAVVTVSPVSGGDRAGNAVAAVVPAAGNLRSGIAIDTVAPTITKFDSTSPNGTYRPGSSITIRAFASEVLQAGATVNATLNSGAVVTLSTVAGQTLSGSYTVQPGEVAGDLDVVSMTVASGRDLAGNALAGSIVVPAGNRLAEGHDLVIDGSITALTPAGFSSNPLLVPDLKRTVTSIPIKFTAPVTGLTIANFTLLYSNRAQTGGRSLSLRGATLTGSGTDYVLRLPSRTTSLTGIYTLQIDPNGIFAAVNGRAMTERPQIFWGKGRSIGMAAIRATTTVRR